MVGQGNSHTIEMGQIWDGWEGTWAKVKPHMSFASRQRIDSAAVHGSMKPGDADEDKTMDLSVTTFETGVAWIEGQVREWNFVDYNGSAFMPDRGGLNNSEAPIDLIEQLIDAMDDFYDAQRPPVFRKSASNN